MNDCRCRDCERVSRGEIVPWLRVLAKGPILGNQGQRIARRGTVGELEDIDTAERWLIVTFPGHDAELVYPHEVRIP